MDTTFCTECGVSIDFGSKFCAECGTPVTEDIPKIVHATTPPLTADAPSFEAKTERVNSNSHSPSIVIDQLAATLEKAKNMAVEKTPVLVDQLAATLEKAKNKAVENAPVLKDQSTAILETIRKALSNGPIFVAVYFVFMLATYVLPYGGSNSALIQSTASSMNAPQTGHFQLLFWMHFGSLVSLCFVTWLRGSHVKKSWLVIFPVIAGLFDLTPGLSLIPLVPTIMHICALIMGARGSGSPTS